MNHLQYSYGSCREVEVLLMLAFDLNYIEKDIFNKLIEKLEELKASLYNFMRTVEKEIALRKENYYL